MDFWDTSALIKLYHPEPDSAWFEAYAISQSGPFYVSSVTEVEIGSPIVRRILQGTLKPSSLARVRGDFRRDAALGRLISIPCTQEVINRAVGVADSAASAARPGILRSLDAIQVATALVVGAKTMVATDVRLREAASRNGLKLIPR